jgi:hypothetical protein
MDARSRSGAFIALFGDTSKPSLSADECKRNAKGMQKECKRNAKGMQNSSAN